MPSTTENIATIVNRNESLKKTIVNSQLSTVDKSKRVDVLLEDCADLIDPLYKRWFAKMFFRISPDRVYALASSCRETALYRPDTHIKKLFTSLVKREAGF